MVPANSHYAFLNSITPQPRHMQHAISLYGTKEAAGSADNSKIIAWDEEIGRPGIFSKDSTPWCGLFVALCLFRAGRPLLDTKDKYDILRALKWADWGRPVSTAMYGDLLVFSREGGGHVGFYVGEDDVYYHVLGGNQNNEVNVSRITRGRCVAINRPEYNNQPSSVKQVRLSLAGGPITTNEA